MSDKVMLDAADGVVEHLEDILLHADADQQEDVIAASLILVMAILKPISETMLASTSGRSERARARMKEESIEVE